jgi:FkbM family methyltransferase
MIPNPETNGHNKGLIASTTKKLVDLLPPSAPGKIYNAALKIPIARDIMGIYIRSLIPEKITTRDGTIFLDRTDVAVSGALALGGFESYEANVFRDAIKPGMNIVDIGAHIGYYALLSAKQTGPLGKVFAYEPEPGNFNLLQKNATANQLSNIIPLNTALSDTSGSRELFLEKYNKGHHSFARNKNTIQTISVPTQTLDDSLKGLGSPRIDIIKIDVEGAEPIVLRGMRETIRNNPGIRIFTEVYPRSMAKLGESAQSYLKELTTLGFSLSVINEDTKSIFPVGDIQTFIASFPKGESFKNILGVRTK